MGNKILTNVKFLRIMLAIAIVLVVATIYSLVSGRTKTHVEPQPVLEMTMTPIDGAPGEFILEYSNGRLEHLKIDGTRAPLAPITKDGN